jgi:hypothetical protein
MLRRKRVLIGLTVVIFCFVAIKPAEACDNWNLLDGDGSLWELFWEWLTSLFDSGTSTQSEYYGNYPEEGIEGIEGIESVVDHLQPIVVIS